MFIFIVVFSLGILWLVATPVEDGENVRDHWIFFAATALIVLCLWTMLWLRNIPNLDAGFYAGLLGFVFLVIGVALKFLIKSSKLWKWLPTAASIFMFGIGTWISNASLYHQLGGVWAQLLQ